MSDDVILHGNKIEKEKYKIGIELNRIEFTTL